MACKELGEGELRVDIYCIRAKDYITARHIFDCMDLVCCCRGQIRGGKRYCASITLNE